MRAPIETLQRRLGYRFDDAALLDQALTHRSCGGHNNERLEFLGDGLINFVVAATLFEIQPGTGEGALSRLRASLVRESTLAELARDLELGDLLRLGDSERKSGGYRRDSILADAFEAVLGAIYMDGGFDAARRVALHLFGTRFERLPDAEVLKDPKTRLQELLQGVGRPLPVYEVLSEEGPPHARRFRVCCTLPDTAERTQAEGSSRRGAEQRAAEACFQRLTDEKHGGRTDG